MNELFEPVLWTLPETPKIVLTYYELRVWRNHLLVKVVDFRTKKEAINYYKDFHYDDQEEYGQCYIEIIKINPLKKPEN